MSENSNENILEVKNLHTSFFTESGEVKAVNGVSFSLRPGEIMGIVGESGSGKSVTAYSIMQILADTGRIMEGQILYKGEDVTKFDEKENGCVPRKTVQYYFPGSYDQSESGVYDRKSADGGSASPYKQDEERSKSACD